MGQKFVAPQPELNTSRVSGTTCGKVTFLESLLEYSQTCVEEPWMAVSAPCACLMDESMHRFVRELCSLNIPA